MTQEKVLHLANNDEELLLAKKRFKLIFPNSSIVSGLNCEKESESINLEEIMCELDAFSVQKRTDEEKELFYQEKIKNIEMIPRLIMHVLIEEDKTDYGKKKIEITGKIYGKEYAKIYEFRNRNNAGAIIDYFMRKHIDYQMWFQIGWVVMNYLCSLDVQKIKITSYRERTGHLNEEPFEMPIHQFQTILLPIVNMRKTISICKEERYFELIFPVLHNFYQKDDILNTPLHAIAKFFNLSFMNQVIPGDYILACAVGIVSFQELIDYLFSIKREADSSEVSISDVLANVSYLYDGMRKINASNKNEDFKQDDSISVANEFFVRTQRYMSEEEQNRFICMLYETVINHVLDNELNRGNKKGEFSSNIYGLVALYGAKRVMPFLAGVEQENIELKKGKSSAVTKKSVWNYLLKIAKPDLEDTKRSCMELVESYHISSTTIENFLTVAPSWENYLSI